MGPDVVPSQESASLVKRLAGPSSGKAGLAIDQSEINRIIADVSKGSKFYENEKKKDKELTERIDKVIRERDEALKGADIHKIELATEKLLAQLETERDLTQIIVHVDMDAFYASVELLDNPDLTGKAFGVGHGVLCTASYEARKFGVRSGMAGFVAKKLCPDLILIPLHFSRYSELSNQIMSIFQSYDPTMLPAGCDEAYLNITSYCEEHGITAEECVQQMRTQVFEETKLTVSAGIAPNKMLAKICSDRNKPNGQFQIPFDSKSINEFMHDLSIRKIPFIGRVNERLLESVGIRTCGDIFTHRAIISLMDKRFGLIFLLRTYLGIGSNIVQPHRREERKSIGAERTFSPLADKDRILQKLQEVAVELENDMEKTGWTGRTVTLKYKLDTYQVFTRAKSFDGWISGKAEDLLATGKELLLPELPLKIRLIGLRVTKLKDLRASSTNGIKRFFESVKNDSPRKKRKLEHEDLDVMSHEGLDEEEHADSMPGFHELDEEDNLLQDDVDDLGATDNVEFHDAKTVPKPRPPVSAPGRILKPQSARASTSRVAPHTTTRPRSNSEAPRPSQNSEQEGRRAPTVTSHDCPICGKTLQTDNQGLNTHIDFCLSRGAIFEAQAQASPTKANGWEWLKPPKGAKDDKNPLTKQRARKSSTGKRGK